MSAKCRTLILVMCVDSDKVTRRPGHKSIFSPCHCLALSLKSFTRLIARNPVPGNLNHFPRSPHVPLRSVPNGGGALGDAEETRGPIQVLAQRLRPIESLNSKVRQGDDRDETQ